MSDKALIFNGSIPKNYDDLLGPFVFEPFALDLAKRIDYQNVSNILELACGTGRLTRHLLTHLAPSARLTATDLIPDMLDLAKDLISAGNITWETVDMLDIPYKDNQFDLIVSQFGLMLVPDRPGALNEIYRVLQPGGRVVYNVWGDLEANDFWDIGGRIVSSFLGVNPIRQDPGPFTMQDEQSVLQLMGKTGFVNNIIHSVKITGVIEQAAMAAKGFVQGLPIYRLIQQKDPALTLKIQEALEIEFINKLGDQPVKSSLLALVVEATKLK